METFDTTSTHGFLNIPIAPPTSPSWGWSLTDETRVKRTIVELKMDCCSYNEIAAYFRRIEGLNVSRNYISSVLVEAGERAKILNGIYDSKVREHFRVIEVDEVFQGNSAC